MIQEPRYYTAQVAVIGTGLAGFAASVFALNRGLSTAQVGNTGAIAYTTGYLDLFGGNAQGFVENPWQGLAALRTSEPHHPLARVGEAEIRASFAEFIAALNDMGIAYTDPGAGNLFALTPAGTTKPTLSVPQTMRAGIGAKESNAPALIIDIEGLQGFSAKELVANFKATWPNLRARHLTFPGMEDGAQTYPEVMARALEVPATRTAFAARIKAVLGTAAFVGMPAILGVHKPDRVHREMKTLIGVPVFEIPTLPPAVPGIRLREMFEQTFPAKGLTLVPQKKVERLDLTADHVTLHLHDSYGRVEIKADTAILATGRFLSGGLHGERGLVRETLLDLPVTQPAARADWYRRAYLDNRGHPVNRAGIEVDDHFRPLNGAGEPHSPRLFAAGAVLAHQDWIRQRCGAGISLASAYGAVAALSKDFPCP